MNNLTGTSPAMAFSPKDRSPVDVYESPPLSFANLSQQIINQSQIYSKGQMLYFNGHSYNINFNSPRTLTACFELGLTKEIVQEQINTLNQINKPRKNELPEIKEMKIDHYNRKISETLRMILVKKKEIVMRNQKKLKSIDRKVSDGLNISNESWQEKARCLY